MQNCIETVSNFLANILESTTEAIDSCIPLSVTTSIKQEGEKGNIQKNNPKQRN